MDQGRSFFFAGGGTGGHIYPALAVAQQLQQQAPAGNIHFLCSTRPIDQQILEKTEFDFTTLPAQGLSLSPQALFAFVRSFQASVRQARTLLQESPAPVVIGVGGFVAGPVCWAAQRLGIPIVLINVDILAGKANKLAGRWARDIFLQFDEARTDFRRFKAHLHTVGCPLRQDFTQPDPQRAVIDLGLDPAKKILLITGASSGAQRINEAVIALLGELQTYADTWQIVHLTGTQNYEQVNTAYQNATISHQVVAYYDHMADLQAAASLIIGRSGAVSVAEYAIAGVPTICMPYPFHKDRHQYRNAGKLVEVGAAVIVDDVPNKEDRVAWLWEELEELMQNDTLRNEMGQAATSIARPQAAAEIAKHLLTL